MSVRLLNRNNKNIIILSMISERKRYPLIILFLILYIVFLICVLYQSAFCSQRTMKVWYLISIRIVAVTFKALFNIENFTLHDFLAHVFFCIQNVSIVSFTNRITIGWQIKLVYFCKYGYMLSWLLVYIFI